ncbi:MAG: NVEALA domain-containing protein [Tannerellaceae bacterium]|jgi:hypothetical protein|nr:NVEALA domain-containing protein [Tannerellaceae bacterium]
MKSRLTSIVFVAAIAIAAAWNFTQSSKAEVELSDLALTNVEALASGEGTSPCKGYGSVLCTYNNIWVYSQG